MSVPTNGDPISTPVLSTALTVLPVPSAYDSRLELTVSNPFFDHPILNSPYKAPSQHWELDESGQPTQNLCATFGLLAFIADGPHLGSRLIVLPFVVAAVWVDWRYILPQMEGYEPTQRDLDGSLG